MSEILAERSVVIEEQKKQADVKNLSIRHQFLQQVGLPTPYQTKRKVIKSLRSLRRYIYQRQRYKQGEAKAGFIVGVQRSGTNMLINALGRSAQIYMYNENDPRAFDDFRLKPLSVQKQLVEQVRAEWAIFKPICDLQYLDQYLEAHPQSKAIWIYRYYQDVANSALRVKDWDPLSQMTHIERMAEDAPCQYWFCERATPEMRAFAKRHLEAGISMHAAAALKWYLRNWWYFELGLNQMPERVMLVNYERLAQHPIEVFTRIYDFLDIELDAAYVSQISPRSIRKNPFPEISADVSEACETLMDRLNNEFTKQFQSMQ